MTVDAVAAVASRAAVRVARVALPIFLVAAIAELGWHALGRSAGWPLPLAWPLVTAWLTLLWGRGRGLGRGFPEPNGPAVWTPTWRLTQTLSWAVAGFAGISTVLAWIVLTRTNRFAGHDEAVYAGMARAWDGPLPAAGSVVSRPVGLPALGALVLAPFADAANPADADLQLIRLRVLELVLVLATLGAMLLLGSAVTSPARAATAVLVVAGAVSVLRRLPEVLVDLPAAGLLCLVMLAVLRWLRTRRLGWIVAAAVLAALTFYLRYGAVAGLLAIAVGALVAAGPRELWRRRGQLATGAAVLLVALTPHLAWSWRQTGTPWGVLVASEGSASRTFIGEGLAGYLVWVPYRLAGDLGGVLLVAAVIGLVAALRRPHQTAREAVGSDEPEGAPPKPRTQWIVLFGVTALVQTVALGLQAQPEERFVYFPIMLGAITGLHVLAQVSGRYARPVVAVVALLAVLHVPGSIAFERFALQQTSRQRAPLVAAASALRLPRPCLVVGPRYGPAADPEAGWYSGCQVSAYSRLRRLPTGRTALALLRQIQHPDPRVSAAAARLVTARGATSRQVFPGNRTPGIQLIRLRPPPAG